MRILFWGTPTFAVPTLRALTEEGYDVVGVVTQPDRPAGRGRVLRASPVKELALAEGIPVFTPDRPRGEAFMDQIRALEPDLSVVVAYGHILVREVLDLPRLGSINVHASLLPALRGAAPIHWAIARGDVMSGVTVMRMVEGMDAGPVLYRVEEPIGPEETSTELAARLSELGAQALIEALTLLAAGALTEQEQDHELATFAPKVSRAAARIDWTRAAREVADHVRAMDEVPGAWTTLDGDPLKLFRPRLGVGDGGADGSGDHEPGAVIDVAGDPDRGLGVAAGDGVVWFDEVQPPGRRRMAAGAWLRGRSIAGGTRFE
ncbi:MAG: methionyl-tRNA formyltransferase [Gemmatimonadetes bacterium]|nr:methionyl-tRNA formyltransferase [Gemmatimonadota bacterium]MBT8403580.1 methionyl-tRNA formyltransferase [Gemmatimonadota bacterium]NNK61775.1 methionyl-tRNA formyltransferase [Gemmatimonadota bacterium]